MMKKLLMMMFFCSVCHVALAQTTANSAPMAAPASTLTPVPATTDNVNPDLVVTGAYVQPLIPGQKNTAAYMTISNNTKRPYVLIGADSSMAARTELHTVLMKEGMMHMQNVDAITLLPGQQVILQPGDFHIMLMGVNTDLTQDTYVPICLEFKESDTMCIDTPVEDKRAANASTSKNSSTSTVHNH